MPPKHPAAQDLEFWFNYVQALTINEDSYGGAKRLYNYVPVLPAVLTALFINQLNPFLGQ